MAQEAPKGKTPAAPAAAEAAPAAASGGGGGWLPIIAVVVLVPVLSFVMAEFVLFPRLAQKLGAGGAAAGDHGEAAAAAKPADKAPVKGEPTHAYEFKNIVSNLAGSMKSRYIKVSFTAYSADAKIAEIVEANRAKLLDATLGVLGTLTLADLEDPTVKNKVRNNLVQTYESVLRGRVIEEIYFSEFVIQ